MGQAKVEEEDLKMTFSYKPCVLVSFPPDGIDFIEGKGLVNKVIQGSYSDKLGIFPGYFIMAINYTHCTLEKASSKLENINKKNMVTNIIFRMNSEERLMITGYLSV